MIFSGDPPPSQEEISRWVKKEMGDNWRSAGYDQFNRKVDAEWHAYFMFITVSLGLVVVSFIFAYTPDRAMSDWAIREVGRRRGVRSLCVFALCAIMAVR
jgi:hypothetical protein